MTTEMISLAKESHFKCTRKVPDVLWCEK